MVIRTEPATGKQLHYIAILCMQLNITDPIEQRIKTSGAAGMVIRNLEWRRKHVSRKGNNSAT